MARLQTPKPHEFVLNICKQAGVKLRKFRSVKEFEQEVENFMKKHDMLISTSLDGPDYLHDKNRPSVSGEASHKVVTNNITFRFHEIHTM